MEYEFYFLNLFWKFAEKWIQRYSYWLNSYFIDIYGNEIYDAIEEAKGLLPQLEEHFKNR